MAESGSDFFAGVEHLNLELHDQIFTEHQREPILKYLNSFPNLKLRIQD
jgi:hypothetical protein